MLSNPAFKNIVILSENEHMVGFWTGINKNSMDMKLKNEITFNRLLIALDFISLNEDPSLSGTNIVEKLLDEIEAMKEYILSKGVKETQVITSILDEKMNAIAGLHDDLQRALSLLIHAVSLYLSGLLPLKPNMVSYEKNDSTLEKMMDLSLKRGADTINGYEKDTKRVRFDKHY
jgi:hypothetical protein